VSFFRKKIFEIAAKTNTFRKGGGSPVGKPRFSPQILPREKKICRPARATCHRAYWIGAIFLLALSQSLSTLGVFRLDIFMCKNLIFNAKKSFYLTERHLSGSAREATRPLDGLWAS
jgi:hypothetical protein